MWKFSENPAFLMSGPWIIQSVCRAKVEALQKQYVESTKGLASQLVLFEDALMHLTRICRVLGLDGAHALLVGVGGSGKQSLAKLAAYISGAALSIMSCLSGMLQEMGAVQDDY